MNPISLSGCASTTCPACGSSDIKTTIEQDAFEYGEGVAHAHLSVDVRVHHCSTCGTSYTNEDASEARHLAICAHLKVLAPKQIKEIRRKYEVSQSRFAEVTKIGKASLARWESGLLIQNPANDSLLYLLTYEENWKRLIHRVKQERSEVQRFSPRFRSISEEDIIVLREEADKFHLFPEALGAPLCM